MPDQIRYQFSNLSHSDPLGHPSPLQISNFKFQFSSLKIPVRIRPYKNKPGANPVSELFGIPYKSITSVSKLYAPDKLSGSCRRANGFFPLLVSVGINF